MTFAPGTQVAYLPPHANGDINHPDVEYGFVTSANSSYTWCRFFWNEASGRPWPTLRTTNNSEPVSRGVGELRQVRFMNPKHIADIAKRQNITF